MRNSIITQATHPMNISVWILVLANLAIACGTMVQTTVGFGLSMVALPLLLSLDKRLAPGPLLISGIFLLVALTSMDRADVQREPLLIALAAAVPGTVVGVAALALLSPLSMTVITALVLVFTTVIAARRVPLHGGAFNIFIAGLISGFCGTTTSINGPPMVAVMAGSYPITQVRATVVSFLLFSSLISLVGLALGHQLTMESLYLALAITPGLFIGVFVSRRWLRDAASRMAPRTLFLGASSTALAIFIAREVWRYSQG